MKPLTAMSAAQYRTPKTEAELQRQIVKTAKTYGWTVTHYPYALGADPGHPDLTLLKPGCPPLWIECKGPKGRLKPEQVAYLALVNQTAGAIGIAAFPPDLDAVGALLAGEAVELYADETLSVQRVRLLGETR